MTDQGRKRPKRSGVAARFDEITLAAFTVLVIATVVAVFVVGVATADELPCSVGGLAVLKMKPVRSGQSNGAKPLVIRG